MPDENPLTSIEGKLKKQPWYVWAGALGTMGIVGWYVIKNRAAQAATPATGTTPADPNALTPADQNAIDNGFQLASMAGMPYGYVSDHGPVDNYPNVPPGGTPPTPPTPPPPTPPPTPPPGGHPANWYANLLGKIPYYATINPGGTDGNGQRFWYGTNQLFYAPPGSTIAPGGAGRLWLNLPGKPANQQGLLLTGPGSSSPHGSGGVPVSPWQSMLNHGRSTIDQHAATYGLTSE